MTAPIHDQARPDRQEVARYWIARCRAILAATRPDPMRRHTAAMTALRKATR